MNRPRRALLLILAVLCVFSLCIVSAGANETTAEEGNQPAQLLIITYTNCKTEYIEGEYFDVTGFRGYVSCYDPQYSFYIAPTALTYLETGPLTTDITEITFVYENVTYKLPITVYASSETPEIPTDPIIPDEPATQIVGFENAEEAINGAFGGGADSTNGDFVGYF